MKAKSPTKPKRPLKPIMPETTIAKEVILHEFEDDETISMEKLIGKIPEAIPTKDVVIDIHYDVHWDSSSFSAKMYYDEEVPDPKLGTKMGAYKKKMKKYKEDMAVFKKKNAEYKRAQKVLSLLDNYSLDELEEKLGK